MNSYTERDQLTTRREFLRGALGGASLGIARRLGLPLLFGQAALASAANNPNRILVIFELSGGNDGLNTVVPYADDAYYRHRPHIGLKAKTLRKLDDHLAYRVEDLRQVAFDDRDGDLADVVVAPAGDLVRGDFERPGKEDVERPAAHRFGDGGGEVAPGQGIP